MAGKGALRRKNTWPWSRRKTQWDPPTLLDKILSSPLRYIIHIIYHILLTLRGPPIKPHPSKPAIRIICISDTHNNTLPIAHGDVLIHAGDLTNKGTVAEIQKQLDWLAGLPHKQKIVIAGNHDSYFDPSSRRGEDASRKLDFKGIHYLENASITLEFKGGRKLEFYGSPDIPACGGSDFAFQYPKYRTPWGSRIPPSTDILITHTPPAHHLDLSLGCPDLLKETWSIKPKLHVFGHVHSGHGREAVYWDEGQLAYERLMSRERGGVIGDILPSWAWLDAVKVILYGIRGVLWQRLMVGKGGGNGGIMLNAAVVYRSSTDVGNKAQVVEI